jgi:hypothetical protein
MRDTEELLDEEALAADRLDLRRAAVFTVVALGAIVVASVLAVWAGIPAA